MEDRKISMLYIGDRSVVAYMHKQNYRSVGIQMHFCEDLTEAERVLEVETVDLIVVNINSVNTDASRLIQYFSSGLGAPNLVVATGIPSFSGGGKIYIRDGAKLFIEQPLPLSHFAEKIFLFLGHKVRKHKRAKGGCLGSVFCLEDKVLIECDIENLSAGGAKIRSPGKLSLSKGTFKIHLRGHKKRIEIFGEIKAASKTKIRGSEDYFYHLHFLSVLDDDLELIKRLIAEDGESFHEALYYK